MSVSCSFICTRMSQKFCNIYICTSFQNKLQGLEKNALMLHPAYSTDQANLDNYLFHNQEEGQDSVKEFFTLKDMNRHQDDIKKLTERWLQAVKLHFGCLIVFVVSW